MKFHALAQLEGVCQSVRGDLPALGQPGFELARGVLPQQGVEDRPVDDRGVRRHKLVRVEAGRLVAVLTEHERAARFGRAAGGGATGGSRARARATRHRRHQGRDQCHGEQRFSRHGSLPLGKTGIAYRIYRDYGEP
ncbi:metallopeptidase TldD-related protein [Nonomuraea sp. NEAU-A123]|uniref:metallopeptidase TldD-related protein n=1 Tax=Nonomuraea sp. NEAU-A123 TaxID=2839649 RepID=UPI0035AB88C3